MSLERVLICDNVHPICSNTLKEHGVQVVVKDKMTKEELLHEVSLCDGLILRSATKVTAEVLKAAKQLKLIGRAGVGVDNIDCKTATREGIMVMNTPKGNSISAAEHTIAVIAGLARHIPQADASLKQGKWDRKAYMGEELYGKTLAIIGLGNIGREVAKRMEAFGMTLIGFDPLVSAEDAESFGVQKMELEQLWPKADYITVHVPLIKQTHNLINKEVLSKCKKGVRVVNVARGGIVDESALLESLESGHCKGAALDVFVDEPPKNMALVRHPFVIATPHLGASTVEAQFRVAQEITQQFLDYIQGRTLSGLVNAASLKNAHTAEVKCWVNLGQALGQLTASLWPTKPSANFSVDIALYGDELDGYKPVIITSVLTGLMKHITNNGTNMVNAPTLAEEAGIVTTAKAEQQIPSHLSCRKALKVSMLSEGVFHSLTGSVQGETITLYEIDGASFPNGLTMGGNMLFFSGNSSNSLSSIIAAIAQQHVPIASVLLSSASKLGDTWYMVRTDDKVPRAISSIPDANFVASVNIE